MAVFWKEVKDYAVRDRLPLVYHDCNDGLYGACRDGEDLRSFRGGVFIKHRCICMPASISPEELEAKEKRFLKENPDW